MNDLSDCLARGLAYEKKVQQSLVHMVYQGTPLKVFESTAGGTKESDVRFSILDKQYSIEVKDKGAFEGGQKRMVPGETGLYIPEECLHKECLGSYIPFQGRVPSFLRGNKTPETWAAEKHQFADEYIAVSSQTICEYYKRKGESYIQIEGKGLYHLGNDVLNLNVPEFVCQTKMRIRCKCHKSVPMTRSIMASFCFDRKTISSSPYDLVSNPPPAFTKQSEPAIGSLPS